jgi:hypothetical protein
MMNNGSSYLLIGRLLERRLMRRGHLLDPSRYRDGKYAGSQSHCAIMLSSISRKRTLQSVS